MNMELTNQLENEICPVICLDSVRSTETDWLWYPYIPFGKLTVIQGDPGEGKSTFALYLAAQLTTGRGIDKPNQLERAPRIVCYQNAEDGIADTIKPRLESAGADCKLVLCADESAEPISITDGRLELMMRRFHPSLMVLDPLQAYLGADVDMHRANEIRPVMSYLSALAEQYHCAVVLIGHMNKMQKTRSLYRGLGSIDITAAARSVLLIARDPSHPENRVITQIKNSLAPAGEPVAFTLDADSKVQWLGKYEITLDEMLSGENRNYKPRDKAADLIRGMFQERETVSARSVIEAAEKAGISITSLKRARDQLGIHAFRDNKQWYWTTSKSQSENG